MAKVKALTWMEIAAAALVGGLGYAGFRHAHSSLGDKLRAGDVVTVPLSKLTLSSPAQAASLNLSALGTPAGVASAIVTAVDVSKRHVLAPNAGTAQATTGRDVGLQVAVSFPLDAVLSITRDGKAIS